MEQERGPPCQQLPFIVYDVSSFSGEFSPNHILEDRQSDQKSRWLSDGNKPPQYVILKLTRPTIVWKIVFGKYEKSHPCNIQKLEIYGGLDTSHFHLMLEGTLANDSVPETLLLHHEADKLLFPCHFIKIVPLQSWGGSFNFSIWHVQLWGVSDEAVIDEALGNLRQYKEKESVRLCLKYLRQSGYYEAFQALQAKSKVLLEHPLLSSLHQHLVGNGDYKNSERIVCSGVEDGLFDGYLSEQPITAKWTLVQCDSDSSLLTPGMRGGHQMIADSQQSHLYLHGGWGGTKDLGDFWKLDVRRNQWTCLSSDTAQMGGPEARSCHCVCYDPQQRVLYVLGRYADSLSMFQQTHPQSDFFTYSMESEKWQLLSSDTSAEGGPRLIYNHQMVCDPETGLLYVLGGNIVSTDMCSGLYAYHTVDRHWVCLVPDQSSETISHPFLPRSGHIMLFHKQLQQLFVLGGLRQQELLSDMLKFDVKSGETTALSNVPMDGPSLRAAMDLCKNQICLYAGSSWLDRHQKKSNTLWLYDIRLDAWSQVMKHGNFLVQNWPVPRTAHTFVFDATNCEYYLFGGNPSSEGSTKHNPSMRLDDMWRLQLHSQSREGLLRECQVALRKLKYLELAQASPVDALLYLQTCIAPLVNHDDEDEGQQYRQLTGVLFGHCSAQDSLTSSGFCEKERNQLFDKLSSYFPKYMSQPQDSITDFVKIQ